MKCRRCDTDIAGRSVGGLCVSCFNLPVGERMVDPKPPPPPTPPAPVKWTGREPPPKLAVPAPTHWGPGTREKLLEMAARWERTEQIHSPDDARPSDDDAATLPGTPLTTLTNHELNELLEPILAPSQKRRLRKVVA